MVHRLPVQGIPGHDTRLRGWRRHCSAPLVSPHSMMATRSANSPPPGGYMGTSASWDETYRQSLYSPAKSHVKAPRTCSRIGFPPVFDGDIAMASKRKSVAGASH